MGNQASKVIEKSKERKERRSTKSNRRRSTITLGGRSHSSLVMAANTNLQANYDWIDEKQDPPLIHTPPPATKSRRQSITEFFSGRKKSLVQDDFREYDRLQRQVRNTIYWDIHNPLINTMIALLVKECS
jgi:hypothetical protein